MARKACLPERECQGAARKKIPGTTLAFFWGGTPRGGGGYEQKIFRKNFSGPQKRRFLEIYPTPLNLEGANRILFKVSTDILTDMGDICGLIPRSDHAVFQDATLSGCITPARWGPKSGWNCYVTPVFVGVPRKGDKLKAPHSKKKMEKNTLPLCTNPCWSSSTLSAAEFEPGMWQSQHHCFSTKVQAKSNGPLLKDVLKDGIDICSNMFFIYY